MPDSRVHRPDFAPSCPICAMGLTEKDLLRETCPRCETPLLPIDFGLTLAEFQKMVRRAIPTVPTVGSG